MASAYQEYLTAVQSQSAQRVLKVEILDANYNITNIITPDILSGDIQLSSDSGARRNCNLVFNNYQGDYIPDPDGQFWINTKYRIYTGYKTENYGDYFVSRGVFLSGEPQVNSKFAEQTVELQLYDQWANLDGTLAGTLDSTYIVPINTDLMSAVKQVFIDAGETKSPIFDSVFILTPYTLIIEAGGTYADILLKLADMVSYVVYYDRNGNPRFEPPMKVNRTNFKYGTGGSAYFDGTNSYLSVPPSSDWELQDTGVDFALGFWVKFDNLTGNGGTYNNYITLVSSLKLGSDTNPRASFILYYKTSEQKIKFSTFTGAAYDTTATSALTLSTNNWYYIEVMVTGSTVRLYIDGVNNGVGTRSAESASNPYPVLTNMVTNGSFESGSTGWTANGSISVVDTHFKYGTHSAGHVETTSPGAYMHQTLTGTIGHKYYLSLWCKNLNNVSVYNNGDGGIGNVPFVPNLDFTFGSSLSTATGTDISINLGWNSTTSNGAGAYIDGVMMIDLTASFGAGNEPTQAQMDTFVNDNEGWWDSSTPRTFYTQLTIGADYAGEGRFKGYIDDLYIENRVYSDWGSTHPVPTYPRLHYVPSGVVVLVLSMDGVNNGTTFEDYSYTPKTITSHGNVKIVSDIGLDVIETDGSVWTYTTSDNLYLGSTRRYEYTKVKNYVKVIGSNIEGVDVSAISQDTNSTSPTRVALIGKKTLVIQDDLIYNDTLALMRADYELKKSIQVIESINAESVPVDVIEGGDIITITDDGLDLNADVYLVKSVSFPLMNDGNQTMTLWKARSLT